ncbi:hypothetical protein P346_01664 [Enterobacter sp. DC1]|uniref:hypothetical protein n=1 Tax=Enterobacter sp. DC1 TaxID=314330 RepID=UPI0003ED00DA|nr:hypothetical protein [Enterobacter sp. DC1]EWG70482.1 hypothetical protein P346_01664 [Enterobacter sp. DC1]
MSTITREQAKDLRNAFQCWQQDYDPVEDKEQYDMFGLGVVAMDALLASLEAEAVGEVVLGEYDDCGSHPDAKVVCIAADGQADWENFKDGTRLYAAPPSPAEIDERDAFNDWNNDENLPIAGVGAKNAAWLAWQARAKLYTPPAPVFVPDRSVFEKWWESEYGSPLDSWDSLRTTDGYCDDGIDGQFEAWNACRAAMLQGVETVTTAYKLPFKQWLSQQGERIEIDCGCVSVEVFMHWLRMAYGAGNSPVVPDWQAKAEKLAELHGSSFVVFRNGESPQCADPTKVIISFTDEGRGHAAAAPQKEVKP